MILNLLLLAEFQKRHVGLFINVVIWRDYMYVCIYVCMYICMFVCMYAVIKILSIAPEM
jgi:hypothetical protein